MKGVAFNLPSGPSNPQRQGEVDTGSPQSRPEQLLFRDVAECGPVQERYGQYLTDDIYKDLPPPQWEGLVDEIWSPAAQKSDLDESAFAALNPLNSVLTKSKTLTTVVGFGGKLRRKQKKNLKNKFSRAVNGNKAQFVLGLLTVWALFADDIRVWAWPKQSDFSCGIISFIALLFFLLELGIRSWAQRGYFMSFFFWLDLLASISLLPHELTAPNTYAIFVSEDLSNEDTTSDTGQGGQVAKAGRMARTSTRVGRLLRLFRVIRVMKLVAMIGKKLSAEELKEEGEKAQRNENAKPSELGKRLNELITQKVILGVLILLVVMPFVDVSEPPDTSKEQGLIMLSNVYNDTNLEDTYFRALYNRYRDVYIDCTTVACDKSQTSLVFLQMGDNIVFLRGEDGENAKDKYPGCRLLPKKVRYEECPDNILQLREDELPSFFHQDNEAWFDDKLQEEWMALLGLIQTLYWALMMGVGSYFLSKDSGKLVILPIEKMVSTVQRLAEDPSYQIEKVTTMKYETDQLKAALKKISGLLQIGFGVAGNNLVAANLRSGAGTVNPMVPGTTINGAYGFCIIDECEEVLECLQHDILRFINTTAELVHNAVADNAGQPNRNLGEAFLCVWKPEVGESGKVEDKEATRMCDGALTAFRRCVRDIAMSPKLVEFEEHPKIKEYFKGHYKTRLGFGLHYGWAIEGAVGTKIKIDCSYLSPNVNLSARLESATKMYGVNILMSEEFVNRLSPSTNKGVRLVDRVCLKGSTRPMSIFTDDRSNALYFTEESLRIHGDEAAYSKFYEVYQQGMQAFIDGDWSKARMALESALMMVPYDLPCKRVLWHMQTKETYPGYGIAKVAFEAPPDWQGYHILQSK